MIEDKNVKIFRKSHWHCASFPAFWACVQGIPWKPAGSPFHKGRHCAKLVCQISKKKIDRVWQNALVWICLVRAFPREALSRFPKKFFFGTLKKRIDKLVENCQSQFNGARLPIQSQVGHSLRVDGQVCARVWLACPCGEMQAKTLWVCFPRPAQPLWLVCVCCEVLPCRIVHKVTPIKTEKDKRPKYILPEGRYPWHLAQAFQRACRYKTSEANQATRWRSGIKALPMKI